MVVQASQSQGGTSTVMKQALSDSNVDDVTKAWLEREYTDGVAGGRSANHKGRRRTSVAAAAEPEDVRQRRRNSVARHEGSVGASLPEGVSKRLSLDMLRLRANLQTFDFDVLHVRHQPSVSPCLSLNRSLCTTMLSLFSRPLALAFMLSLLVRDARSSRR